MPDAACWVTADEGRLRQVFLNLLGNACKFSQESTIDVVLRKDDAGYFVEVTDHGIGISEEQQRKLFKPFSQGDTASAKKYGVTGQGSPSHNAISLIGIWGSPLTVSRSRHWRRGTTTSG